jgi:hypothetical protein
MEVLCAMSFDNNKASPSVFYVLARVYSSVIMLHNESILGNY